MRFIADTLANFAKPQPIKQKQKKHVLATSIAN